MSSNEPSESIPASASGSRLPSTGPKTPAGKSRSSLNAVRHGLAAMRTVIPGLESPRAWRALRARYFADLKPVGVLEEQLVEELARIEWRLKRALRAEGGAISKKTKANMPWSARDLNFAKAAAKERLKAGVPVIGIDPYDLPDADTLERNFRYEKTMWKRRHQVIEELVRLQAQRQSAPTATTPRAVNDRHVGGEGRTKGRAGKRGSLALSLSNASGDASTEPTPNTDDRAAAGREQPKA